MLPDTPDRAEQFKALKSLASDIASYSEIVSPGDAALAVDSWLDHNEQPAWFGVHDLNLLIDLVAGMLDEGEPIE